MKTVNILIVEDDEKDLKDWKTAINRHNVSSAAKGYCFNFHVDYASSLAEALDKFTQYKFSVAIVDIRLEDTPENHYKNTDGIDVVRKLMSCSTALVTIYTGQKKDAEASIDSRQQEFIKIINKSEVSKQDLLKRLVTENDKIINSILEIKEKFSSDMAALFYDSIWPRWKYWISDTNKDTQETQLALHRHMATHLHATHQNISDVAHPEEYYFIPPLNPKLDTGDILKLDEQLYIIVSARCDLARGENETFHLVKLECMQQHWKELHENGSKSAKGKIKTINDHSKSPKKHFIPQIKMSETQLLGPFFANFNWIRCEENSAEKTSEFLEYRIASLSNEFVPSLVDRLGTYFGRMGDPDYPKPV